MYGIGDRRYCFQGANIFIVILYLQIIVTRNWKPFRFLWLCSNTVDKIDYTGAGLKSAIDVDVCVNAVANV